MLTKTETEAFFFETKFLRNGSFFSRQFFPKLKMKPSQNWHKSLNWEVSKPKCHTLCRALHRAWCSQILFSNPELQDSTFCRALVERSRTEATLQTPRKKTFLWRFVLFLSLWPLMIKAALYLKVLGHCNILIKLNSPIWHCFTTEMHDWIGNPRSGNEEKTQTSLGTFYHSSFVWQQEMVCCVWLGAPILMFYFCDFLKQKKEIRLRRKCCCDF